MRGEVRAETSIRIGAAALLLTPALSVSQPATPPTPEFGQVSKDSVWVTTPERMIRRMLQLADTTKDDVVLDLGAGDGRIPIYAAKHFGARGIAVELEENLVQVARQAAAREGVSQRVQVIRQDLFDADLSPATVLALYISPGAMQRLKPRLLKLAPGTRIVSHQFDLGDWEHDEKVEVEGRIAYLWVVPASIAGSWRVTIPGQDFQLRLDQRYQAIKGSAAREAKELPVLGARVRGTEIRFTTFDRDGTSRHYTGRLEGGRLSGQSDAGLGIAPLAWTAVRATH
jgi:SAM-dependent methyltransferase